MPSAKLGEEEEWAERFVMGWVLVDAPPPDSKSKDSAASHAGLHATSSTSAGGRRSVAMGTREERISFGSDATSRTATPTTMRARSETPTIASGRTLRHTLPPPSHEGARSKVETARFRIEPPPHRRSSSSTTTSLHPEKSGAGRSSSISSTATETAKEWQLVAITYSGDWYRLRIPPSFDDQEDEGSGGSGKKKGKCELMEYRRLHVGGGGW